LSPRARRILTRTATFALAGLLLYLALRGVDFHEIWRVLLAADYRWLIPLGVITLISHLLRAWRWKVFLDALPPDDGSEEAALGGKVRVPIGLAFASLMIGYMANYLAPRLGEVARTAHLSGHTPLRFSTILGTVVADRVLDVACLFAALLSVFVILAGRADRLQILFVGPAMERLQSSAGILALVAFVLLLAIGVVSFLILTSAWSKRRIAPLLGSFRDGFMAITRSGKYGIIAGTTIGMWLSYTTMAYLPFIMLGIAEPYHLTFLDGWSIMVLGTLGIVVPSPGGIGSFHYVTIQTLVHLFGVSADPAATYAVVVHAAQMILYTIIGAIGLGIYGTGFRREDPVESEVSGANAGGGE
jgi:glycosyltransferase 2 family protein